MLCIFAAHVYARNIDRVDEAQNKTLNYAQDFTGLELSYFATKEEALAQWEVYRHNIPTFYFFRPYTHIVFSSGSAVRLRAGIMSKDIPAHAVKKILFESCARLLEQNAQCRVIGVPGTEEIMTDAFNPYLSQHNNAPPVSLLQGIEPSVGNDAEYIPKSQIARVASNEAQNMVNMRFADARYRHDIAQEKNSHIINSPAQFTQMTKTVIAQAADEAFDRYIASEYDLGNMGGKEYQSIKEYFVTAFKQATAQSVQIAGQRFVDDIAAGNMIDASRLRGDFALNLEANIAQAMLDGGLNYAKNSKYAFLRNLEVEMKYRERNKPIFSVTTMQPLHSTQGRRHNFFTQLAYAQQDFRHNYTAGLVYRYLPPSEAYVLGVNGFVDYQAPYSHLRASLGADYQTALWGATLNYYKGISGWQASRTNYQERAMSGADLELSGRMPFLPALEVFGKSYVWRAFDNEDDITGQEFRVEYTPVPAITLHALMNDEGGRDTQFGMGVKLNYKFGAPREYMFDWNEQFRKKSAAEYLFRKVSRENVIRVQERIDPAYIESRTPNVNAFSPANGATNVPVGTDITITFAADVVAGEGDITITDQDDGSGTFVFSVNDSRVSIVNNVVTIDLSDLLLEFGTQYSLRAQDSAFKDTQNVISVGIAEGVYSFTTIDDPIDGFPVLTSALGPSSSGPAFTPRNFASTWHSVIDIGASPNGVIFESGATGIGIAAWFDGANLVFAAGDGVATTTTADTIFASYPIASISQGRHDFVFVADPNAAGELGVYIDGVRVIDVSIPGALDSGTWAGTDNAGYGLVGSSVRAGGNSNPLSGATLLSNLEFYSNSVPVDF